VRAVGGLTGTLRVFAGSVVPGGGVLLAGWSPATALLLYWVENFVGGLSMAARIALHRRMTQLAGHGRRQLNSTVTVSESGRTMRQVHFGSFLAEFLTMSLGFNVGHAIFLAALMGFVLPEGPDLDAVRQGVILIVVFHMGALTFDAWHIDRWPFARLKQQANRLMGRVVLVHLALVGGMFLAVSRDAPSSFFSVFIALKLVTDIGAVLPQVDPKEPPRWLVAVMKRFPKQKGESFEDYWRRTRSAELAQAEQDEQVL
jgi:hypothetical protein